MQDFYELFSFMKSGFHWDFFTFLAQVKNFSYSLKSVCPCDFPFLETRLIRDEGGAEGLMGGERTMR
jgi:hypothetical protein